MHPVVGDETVSSCYSVLKALEDCHNEHTVGKFFGKCNSAHAALSQCLNEEYVVKRAENFRKAKEDREKYEKKKEEVRKKLGVSGSNQSQV